MESIEKIQKIMNERFGRDSVIALATLERQIPFVRFVNGYYEDGAFYVITHGLSSKMQQIEKNPVVAVSGEWFTGHGRGVNLGWFGRKENQTIAARLREVFADWINNGHNDFTDRNTCILCIQLTDGVLLSHGVPYEIQWTEDGSMAWKSSENMKETARPSLCIGVDGCEGGWIAAIIENSILRIEKYEKIGQIIQKYNNFAEFLIDVPIGLLSGKDDKGVDYKRLADIMARKIVSPRTSTVFQVPVREAVYEGAEEAQKKRSQEITGKGINRQALGIISKIREVDLFLQEHDKYKNVIQESHPEVCFARLNGSALPSKKEKDESGIAIRLAILRKYYSELTESMVAGWKKEYQCEKHDVIDAICLAVTACMNMQGNAECIPENPPKDVTGLKMQMVIPGEMVS